MTPLLLLHGALGSAAQFDPLKTLLPEGREIYAPNFPGHGGAPDQGAFSIAGFAEYIQKYLSDNNLSQVDIFGYSMGGYVALYLACYHPDLVNRIFTLGTKFDWTPETAAREMAMLDPEKIEAKVPAFARILAERHAPADWKAVLLRTADMIYGLGAGSGLAPEDMAIITCPVTVGLGELDNMVTPEESKATASLLPNGLLNILPGSKHPIEQTDVVLLAKRLKKFFG
jgi:esterase